MAVIPDSDLGARAIEWIGLGGPIVWILIAMAILAFAIFLLKSWQFSRARIGSTRVVDRALEAWSDGRRSAAIEQLSERREPLAEAVRVAMRATDARASEHLVREETLRIGNAHIAELRRLLRPLELIATLSPLLGLLGTVVGMIEAFQALAAAQNRVDPAILSGGIWQALLTTAVGLSVAIPVTVAHGWLESRIDRFAQAMEDAVTRVFTCGIADGAQSGVTGRDAERRVAAAAA